MGVEYKHFLIPEDSSFVPAKDVVMKIDGVLSKWGLKKANPKVYDLTKGKNINLAEPLENITFDGGLAIEYSEVEGALVAKIMGESYYADEIADDDRYIQRFTLIAGLDYRIHPSSEELDITVKKAPTENSIPIEPYCEYDDFLHYGNHAEAYTSTSSTSPPEVVVWARDEKRIIGQQNFKGFWRTAFIIDCGKDLPKAGNEFYKIPNREFISDLENALGIRVIEIGEFY